ncbi:uncharacterized protein LOC135119356 [Zophobas morio]|uniref:uncharacterized protein LOC135119356 n=1 Tax=Zophobas morio TaxID=2755281 RepID=UPI0030830071
MEQKNTSLSNKGHILKKAFNSFFSCPLSKKKKSKTLKSQCSKLLDQLDSDRVVSADIYFPTLKQFIFEDNIFLKNLGLSCLLKLLEFNYLGISSVHFSTKLVNEEVSAEKVSHLLDERSLSANNISTQLYQDKKFNNHSFSSSDLPSYSAGLDYCQKNEYSISNKLYGSDSSNCINKEEDNIEVKDFMSAILPCFTDTALSEETRLLILKIVLAAVNSKKCHIHSDHLISFFSGCVELYLRSSSFCGKLSAEATLKQLLFVLLERINAASSTGITGEEEAAPDEEEHNHVDDIDHLRSCFENIFQVDGYLIFQYLCELSIVNVQDNSEKNTTLTKRTLALELLLIILKNAGAAFLRHKHFIDGTKRLLCVSLSRNVISSSSRLIELSLALFLVLLKWFKSSLKAQIEILFKNVLLLLLESSTSSLNHKMDVLQAIWYIVSDAQTLQDIFINYDCDISMDNLFTHLIDDLSKIANSGSTNIKGSNLLKLQLQC